MKELGELLRSRGLSRTERGKLFHKLTKNQGIFILEPIEALREVGLESGGNAMSQSDRFRPPAFAVIPPIA